METQINLIVPFLPVMVAPEGVPSAGFPQAASMVPVFQATSVAYGSTPRTDVVVGGGPSFLGPRVAGVPPLRIGAFWGHDASRGGIDMTFRRHRGMRMLSDAPELKLFRAGNREVDPVYEIRNDRDVLAVLVDHGRKYVLVETPSGDHRLRIGGIEFPYHDAMIDYQERVIAAGMVRLIGDILWLDGGSSGYPTAYDGAKRDPKQGVSHVVADNSGLRVAGPSVRRIVGDALRARFLSDLEFDPFDRANLQGDIIERERRLREANRSEARIFIMRDVEDLRRAFARGYAFSFAAVRRADGEHELRLGYGERMALPDETILRGGVLTYNAREKTNVGGVLTFDVERALPHEEHYALRNALRGIVGMRAVIRIKPDPIPG